MNIPTSLFLSLFPSFFNSLKNFKKKKNTQIITEMSINGTFSNFKNPLCKPMMMMMMMMMMMNE